MQSKITISALIAVAFVAGSIMAGTNAFASGDKNGKPFEEIWDALHSLEGDVEDLEADLDEIVYEDPDEESSLTSTYVRTAGAFQQVFCDIGDFATNGGSMGEGFGMPLNSAGEIAKDGESITGWQNFGGGTSFVICVNVD